MERLWVALLLLTGTVFFCESSRRAPKRRKREWLVPTKMLKENFDYSNSSHIARIRSDHDEKEKLYYALSGPGADQRPYNIFKAEEDTGLVFVHGILDREEQETYFLVGVARFHNGTVAERRIELRFDIEDDNDNPPIFPKNSPALSVNESSPKGTFVGPFQAKDRDKEGTLNAKIFYSIIRQAPVEDTPLFYIHNSTGDIHVSEDLLDRERQDSYVLTVKGVDMGGAPSGNSGTGTIEIKVLDINDNVPTLEKDKYAAEIVENVAQVEVMRIKAKDKDLEPTDNWLALFDIVEGNEDGLFSIRTDPATNEGILMLEKPMNFEENPDIKLGVVVTNAAPLVDLGLGLGPDAGLDLDLGLDGGGGGDGDGDGDGEGGGEGDGEGDGDGEGEGGGGGGLDAGPAGASPASGGGGGGGGGAGGAGAEGGLGAPGPDLGLGAGAGGKPKKPRKPKKPKKKPKGKVYAVNIAVQNQPEGASFSPETMDIPVSENPELLSDDVIATYPAIDEDSGKPSEDVSYAKGYDPENLLMIDPETAEIHLLRPPDRESPFVVNGTYIAKIFAMSKGMPSRTATGTIALQVEDVNDNCPSLSRSLEYVCTDTTVIPITGHDPDGDPNGAPFSFKLVPKKSRGDWDLQDLDAVSANLLALTPLWPGTYTVTVLIWDQQGLSCPEPQELEVQVCQCEGNQTCQPGRLLGQRAKLRESAVGPAGLGAALVGLVALVGAAVLLTTCACGAAPGAFSDIPIFTEDHLIVYHTEGQGEDKDFPLLGAPLHTASTAGHLISASSVRNMAQAAATSTCAAYLDEYEAGGGYRQLGGSRFHHSSFGESGQSQGSLRREGRLHIEDMVDFTLPPMFLHHYYTQRSRCATVKDAARDSLLVYEFEGRGSLAGSVDSINCLGSDRDLSFLNDLDPKFRTLAEMCAPPEVPCPIRPSMRSASLSSVQPTPSTPLSLHQQPPMVSIAPTLSRTRDSMALSKSQDFSSLSKLSVQSQLNRPVAPTFQRSQSLANLSVQDTSVNLRNQRLQSASILQLAPLSSSCAAIAPPFGQTMVMQQPVYYVTSPVMSPTSQMYQPAVRYVVQSPIQDGMVFAESRGAQPPGLVLLQNGFGSMEQMVSAPAARAVSLGGRRYMSVIDLGRHLEVEPGLAGQPPGSSLGGIGRRMSESQLYSAGSASVSDIGKQVASERVPPQQGSGTARGGGAENWLNSQAYVNRVPSAENTAESKARRKSRRRVLSMAELREQRDDEEEAGLNTESIYGSNVLLSPVNLAMPHF